MRFQAGSIEIDAQIDHLIVAGWTGRDTDAVQTHIDELAQLGVAPPSQVPLFYRVSASLLLHAQTIEVLGAETSGEVEPLLVNMDGTVWLGLGSDHTDRLLEAQSVAASKQACPKPIGRTLWPLDEVAAHVDQLTMRCWVDEGQGWTLYQDGTVGNILPLGELALHASLAPGGAMLCGTLGAIGGVRPAAGYRMELSDPVMARSMSLEYRVSQLPVVA